MLKKYVREKSRYEKYFLEADGDDEKVSVSVTPRSNRGTDYTQEPEEEGQSVSVPARANRGTDYTQEAEDEPANDTPEDQTNTENETPDENDTQNTDAGNDDTSGGDAGDDAPHDYSADEDNETGSEDEDGDESGDEETGDEEPHDYTSDSEGEDDGETQDDQSTDAAPADPDKLKKYLMYDEFLHLYNAIDNMVERLRNLGKDSAEHNAVVNTVCNNLTDLYDKLHDFMVIKYKTATYIQVLMYFNTALAIVKLNLELIRNNKINLKQ